MRYFVGLLSLLIIFSIQGCSLVINAPLFGGSTKTLNEVHLRGMGDDKVLMLPIEGVITATDSRTLFGGSPNTVDVVQRFLDRARNDENVKALLIRVNSPGGAVGATNTIHHELQSFKQETGIPVIAFFQDVAASGGYYVSMVADEIIAQPSGVSGSIGVFSVHVSLEELMDKIGVKADVIKTGKMKASGLPFKELTSEQRSHRRSMIDDAYDGFVDAVDAGRPGLTKQQILPLADGRVYTAKGAKAKGLIDRVAYLSDAFERAKKLAGISEASLVTYTHKSEDSERSIYTQSVSAPPAEIPLASQLATQLGLNYTGFHTLYLWSPN